MVSIFNIRSQNARFARIISTKIVTIFHNDRYRCVDQTELKEVQFENNCIKSLALLIADYRNKLQFKRMKGETVSYLKLEVAQLSQII